MTPTDILLKTYTEEIVVPVGKCTAYVSYKSSAATLEVYVVDDPTYPALMGRTWLQVINLDWQEICNLSASTYADVLKINYSTLFEDKLGKMKDFQGEMELKPDAKPKFLKKPKIPQKST